MKISFVVGMLQASEASAMDREPRWLGLIGHPPNPKRQVVVASWFSPVRDLTTSKELNRSPVQAWITRRIGKDRRRPA